MKCEAIMSVKKRLFQGVSGLFLLVAAFGLSACSSSDAPQRDQVVDVTLSPYVTRFIERWNKPENYIAVSKDGNHAGFAGSCEWYEPGSCDGGPKLAIERCEVAQGPGTCQLFYERGTLVWKGAVDYAPVSSP